MIPVNSVAGYAAHGRITIDAEAINYTGTSTNTAVCGGIDACFTGARRGVGGSAAASHSTGAAVFQNQCLIRATGTSGDSRRIVERATTSSVGGGSAMIVYAKNNGDGVPYYRLWDRVAGAWGTEATANNVGADIHWLVLKFARTRNEAILGSMNSSGQIRVQVWNGDTLTWGAPQLIATVTANNDNLYRGFDIDYETNSDRAVIVYNDNTNSRFAYRTWDGATLSSQTTVNIPLGAKPRWIETAANPHSTSNELAVIMLDRNNDVYGMRWTGAVWSNMGSGVAWDTDAADSNFRPIGTVWESTSGRALFVWGSNTNRRIYHRVWTGLALSAPQFRDVAALGGRVTWLRVVRDPYSEQIVSGVMNGGRDLNTAMWSGPPGDGWTDHPEHDANTEDGNDRNFDIVFETSAVRAGQAWLMWGGRVAGRSTKRRL